MYFKKKQQLLAQQIHKAKVIYKYIIQLNNNLKLDSMVSTIWFSKTSFASFKFIEHVQLKYQEEKKNNNNKQS